nr:potassium transporter TrkG [uncultured Clostridium sp.]
MKSSEYEFHFRRGTDEEVKGRNLIAGYLGIVMMLAGAITLLPLLTLLFYPGESDQAAFFVIPGVGSILAGYLFSFILRGRKKGVLDKNQKMTLVLGTWLIVAGVACVPFVLSGRYSVSQAVFEAISGLSTTGLSVVDTAAAPHILLIHRTVLSLFGGLGLVLILNTAMSDVYGMKHNQPVGHSDRLLQKLRESAGLIAGIYGGYIVAGVVLYVTFGMNLFDAFNHSVAAVTTGGFSTHPESMGYYHSLPFELITIVLMLLGSTGFFIQLLLIRGKFRDVIFHSEIRLASLLLAGSVLLVTVLARKELYGSIPESFRLALFQAVSALSTTGFRTVDSFHSWPPPMIFILILLMLTGGGAGSMAGGLKIYRVCVMLKEMKWEFSHCLNTNRAIMMEQINRGGKRELLTEQDKREVNVFLIFYLMFFAAGTFIFSCFGYSVQDSMFEFASALSNAGFSVGITSYEASPVIHWTASAGMLFGRLELYVVFMVIARFISDGKEAVVNSWRWKKV